MNDKELLQAFLDWLEYRKGIVLCLDNGDVGWEEQQYTEVSKHGAKLINEFLETLRGENNE